MEFVPNKAKIHYLQNFIKARGYEISSTISLLPVLHHLYIRFEITNSVTLILNNFSYSFERGFHTYVFPINSPTLHLSFILGKSILTLYKVQLTEKADKKTIFSEKKKKLIKDMQKIRDEDI